MKNIVIGIFLVFFSITTYSQYIEGKVLDAETLKPIENVHVYMDHLKDGDLTNNKGYFYLNFRAEKIDSSTIHFSHLAYSKVSISYVKKKKDYTVYLSKKITDLTEIEITEKRNLKPAIKFTKLSSMKYGIRRFGTQVIDNKIYVIGGDASYEIDGTMQALEKYADTDMDLGEILQKAYQNSAMNIYEGNLLIYDIESDTWQIEKDKFKKRAYHNTLTYKNKLYSLGGNLVTKKTRNFLLNNTIDIYDLKKDSIFVDETNPHQALNFASFTYQDKILVMGGSTKIKRNRFKEYTNKVHLLDLKTGYWYELDSMQKGKETSGVLIKDKIYLIGGFNKKPLTEIETFDLISKKWNVEGHLFYGMESPAITFGENIIYIFNNGTISTYDVLTKELNEFLIDLPLYDSEMLFANNKLYIIGGAKIDTFSTNPSASLYSIDISEFYNTEINKSKSLK